jgi:hypothetical protein
MEGKSIGGTHVKPLQTRFALIVLRLMIYHHCNTLGNQLHGSSFSHGLISSQCGCTPPAFEKKVVLSTTLGSDVWSHRVQRLGKGPTHRNSIVTQNGTREIAEIMQVETHMLKCSGQCSRFLRADDTDARMRRQGKRVSK